jgi:hypothetical protein
LWAGPRRVEPTLEDRVPGDSLVIFDGQAGAFLIWDMEGNEGRRIPLAALPGAESMRDLAILDDSTLVVAKELHATRYTDEHNLVSIVDLQTGLLRSEAVRDVPVARESRMPQTRPVYLCAHNGGTGSTAIVVVSNVWQPETVTFSQFPTEVAAHVVTSVEWLPLHYDHRMPGEAGQPLVEMSLACGDAGFAQMHRVFDYAQRPPALQEGMLEVRDYAGNILYRRLASSTLDSIFFGTPRAAYGDLYYFVDNRTRTDYPVIHVFRLVLERTEQ